jgi:hypothetical protein
MRLMKKKTRLNREEKNEDITLINKPMLKNTIANISFVS